MAVEAALGLDRSARVLIQRGLAELKLGVGYADGLFGKKTRGAIREWQEGKGLAVTGHLTNDQAEALVAVGKEAAERAKAQRERVEREREQARLAQEAAERERREREAKARAAAALLAREKAEAERERMRPGREFRDCADCPEMVVVPAGEYMMGSRSGEGDSDERPRHRHRVRIREALAVGKYEVTFAEWDTCVAAGGCRGHRPGDRGWGRGGRPVVNVSWEDAKAYVGWLREKTGKGYRLLSEAEWEYVARASTTGAYHWGEGIGHGRANCDGCGSRWDNEKTAPVGSFKANGFGLHDVHGNVWEWVEDCWHGNYEGVSEDGSAWVSGGDCGLRVLRGGSWLSERRFLRSAYRYRYSPGNRYLSLGFRIARTLTP